MRSLDKQLLEYFEKLPDEVLEKFYVNKGLDGYDWGEESDKKTMSSSELRDISQKLFDRGETTFSVKFNDIPKEELTEDEQLSTFQPPNADGSQHVLGKISKSELSELAKIVKCLRTGKRFYELSVEEMDKKKKEFESKYGTSGEQKNQNDSEWGINWYDMTEIKNFKKDYEEIKEYIENMSPKEFSSKKVLFEELINNNGSEDLFKRLTEIMKNVLGIEGRHMLTVPIAYVQRAFDERQQEIDNNKSKGIFKGFFYKIKSIFSKNKQKALPTGQDTDDKALKTNSSKAYRDEMGGYGSSIDYTKISNQNDRGQTQKNNEFNGR